MKSIKIYYDDGNILTLFDSSEETDYEELSKNIMNSKNIVQLITDNCISTIRPSKVVSIVVEDVEDVINDSTTEEEEDVITDGDD